MLLVVLFKLYDKKYPILSQFNSLFWLIFKNREQFQILVVQLLKSTMTCINLRMESGCEPRVELKTKKYFINEMVFRNNPTISSVVNTGIPNLLIT